jgi:hypothetical protein
MMGVPVSVVDSIVGGDGLLEARLVGTITVAKGVGHEFDKGNCSVTCLNCHFIRMRPSATPI